MKNENAEMRNHQLKRTISIAAAAVLLLVFSGCGGGPSPSLTVTGDCEGFSATVNIPLDKAVAQSQPRAKVFDVFLVGNDGLIAQLSGNELSGCDLVYSKENAWEIKSELHPPSARVKNLARVVIASVSEDPQAVRLMNGAEAQTITAGQLMLHKSLRILKEEGTSQKNGRSVTVYTTQYGVPLTEFFSEENISFAVSGFDGQSAAFGEPESCLLICNENQIDLLLPDIRRKIENIAGVMTNPASFHIAATGNGIPYDLEQAGRVLVFNLDGLGYEMLRRAGSEYAPHLNSLKQLQAMAAYPPISPVSLASMLTGETPDVHGIHSRSDREMACEDIFEKAKAMGKTCAYIEGSQALLNTSLAPVLSLNDKEVYENTCKALEANPDLLFVHFHEIDETAHEYGPYAEQTMQKIKEIDGFVQALCESFDGRVIITADHGLHETEGGGDHGQFLPEDMIVPYIVV